MGASYIHGIHGSIPSGLLTNPIWYLTQEAKIPTHATERKQFLGSYLVNDSISVIRSWYAEYMTFVREATRTSLTNVSLGYYATLFAKKKNFTETQQYGFTNYLYFAIGVTEGTELELIGAKIYLDITSVHYGKEHIFSETGFMALTDYLAKNVTDIRLEKVVTKITYDQNLTEVLTKDGQIYQAEFILITVPLGVLKSKQIEFTPPLPRWKLDVIDRIGFGNYEKIFLLWNRIWWNSSDFHFVQTSAHPTQFRYWCSSDKWSGKPTVTCVFAGQIALGLKSVQNPNQVVGEIQSTLQKRYPNTTIPPPTEIHMTNWSSDLFSLGAYSYISLEQNYEDPHYLAEPLNDRLLFAGEATSADTYGYTHGALLSARREVTRLLFAYNLLPKQSITTSRSTIVTPLKVFIISNFICLHLCFH